MATLFTVAEASRSGTVALGPFSVPNNPTVNNARVVQVSFPVNAADRVDPALGIACTVERRPNGGAPYEPLAGFTWIGNSKPVRPGWPTTGPAFRVVPPDVAGFQVRITLVFTGTVRVGALIETID